jgi:magnesium-transporting ATPase (P-type)
MDLAYNYPFLTFLHGCSLFAGILGLWACARKRNGLLFYKLLAINMVNICTQILHIIAIQLRDLALGKYIAQFGYSMTSVLLLMALLTDTVLLEHFSFLSHLITKRLVLGIRIAALVIACITIITYNLYHYSMIPGNQGLCQVMHPLVVIANMAYAIFAVVYDTSQVLFIGISVLLIARRKNRIPIFTPTSKLIVYYCIYFFLAWATGTVFVLFMFERGLSPFYTRLPTISIGLQAFLQSLILGELNSAANTRARLKPGHLSPQKRVDGTEDRVLDLGDSISKGTQTIPDTVAMAP